MGRTTCDACSRDFSRCLCAKWGAEKRDIKAQLAARDAEKETLRKRVVNQRSALHGLQVALAENKEWWLKARSEVAARDAELVELRKLLAQVCNRVPHFNYREQRWDVSVPKDWPRQRDKALGQGGGGE